MSGRANNTKNVNRNIPIPIYTKLQFNGLGQCRNKRSQSICSNDLCTSEVVNKFSLDPLADSKSLDDYYYRAQNSKYSTTCKCYNFTSERCLHKSGSPDYSICDDHIDNFNKVKSEDLNIDNEKWLEQKPISVLQLDQPDRAVLKIAGKLMTQNYLQS